jgi:hypothetical protein
VLDTRTVAGFSGGQYLVWNVKGHVSFQVTNTSGLNAVISGLFFGSGTAGNSAQFVKVDTATQGNWRGVYGADGFMLANEGSSQPAYGAGAVSGNNAWTWAASTTDVRALQKSAVPTDRIAATWYSGDTFTIDVNLTGGAVHQFAVYAVDWDGLNRTERIDVVDAATGSVLDSRNLAGFSGGQYVVWNLRGHVQLRVVNVNSLNAVVSGMWGRP